MILDGVWIGNWIYWILTNRIDRNYIAVANSHTHYSSLQHALNHLSLLCVHRLSPGNGSQRRGFLGSRPRWLRLSYNSAMLRNGLQLRAPAPPPGANVCDDLQRVCLPCASCRLKTAASSLASSPGPRNLRLSRTVCLRSRLLPSEDWFACSVGRHGVASGRTAQKTPPPVLSLHVSVAAVV